jgi:hypothetical protein
MDLHFTDWTELVGLQVLNDAGLANCKEHFKVI